MALSAKKKGAIALGVIGIGLLGLAGAAKADVLPDVGPPTPEPLPPVDPGADAVCPAGTIRIGNKCIVPPPPPAPNKACNYSGCGAQFDSAHQTPAFYQQRLQILGYPINPAGSIISGVAMTIIREFQRDYNAVRADPPVFAASPLALAPIAAGPKLDTDGLIGNNTIAAIERAHTAILSANTTWGAVVELSA